MANDEKKPYSWAEMFGNGKMPDVLNYKVLGCGTPTSFAEALQQSRGNCNLNFVPELSLPTVRTALNSPPSQSRA